MGHLRQNKDLTENKHSVTVTELSQTGIHGESYKVGKGKARPG